MIWDLITGIVGFLLWLYLLLLIGRLVFDWVQFFARDWRPGGPAGARRGDLLGDGPAPARPAPAHPPLSLGQVRLDLAFIILFFAVTIAAQIVSSL